MEIDDLLLISRKRVFIFLLIISVSVAAICSIMLILDKYDNYRYFSEVFATSLVMVVTSIGGWICEALLEREAAPEHRLLPLVPQMGLVFSLTWAALCLVPIWGLHTLVTEMYLRVWATTAVLSWVFTHVSLLLLARLKSSYSWARAATILAITGLSGIQLTMIWTPYGYDEETGKIASILIILIVAFSALVAIFHGLSKGSSNDVA